MVTTMTETKHIVHSLLIPLYRDNVILPCAAVAEIISFTRPLAVPHAPQWLLGSLVWRGRSIALVSLESMQGQPVPADGYSQVAVMNVQSSYPGLEFYAIAIRGIPRLMRVDAKTITEQEPRADDSRFLLSRVLVKGEPAMIPDLHAVEDLVYGATPH